jgi:hypothetical protein
MVVARGAAAVADPKRNKCASLDGKRSISTMRVRNVASMEFSFLDTFKRCFSRKGSAYSLLIKG